MQQGSAFRVFVFVAGLVTTLTAGSACAQTAPREAAAAFPAKPIRFIVPSSASGGNDVLARMFGAKMTEHWGQQVVIDNRPGAAGIVGSEIVAKAAPDGYTILIVATGYALNPSVYAKLPYDTLNDFARVTLAAFAPNVLVAHPSVPVNSVNELIALAKAKPGTLNYASSGAGTGGHLSIELFKRMAGIQMAHIPYKGAGDATAAVVGGQVQLLMTAPGAAVQQIKAGRLKALGVSSRQRLTAIPDVPTIAEAGLAGYEVNGFYGVLAPARTPRAVIDKLHNEFQRILQMPDIHARLDALGFDPAGYPSDKFTAYVKTEMEKWPPVFRDAGIKPQ